VHVADRLVGTGFETHIDAAFFACLQHDPCFAETAFIRQGRGEKIGQTPAAPEFILIDRFEAQGIQKWLLMLRLFTLVRYRPILNNVERCRDPVLRVVGDNG
jgi:hypothetical protein